jgi:chromosome segregation protein
MTTARDQLYTTINKINTTTRQLYEETFAKARSNFNETFRRFFGGGRADLVPDSEDADPLTAGVEIIARPPGKKLQHISLLSGGERALTALAVLFSLYEIKPSPYCLMDEVDAPLDDQNVKRFCNIIKDYAHSTQFIIITHNKLTMEIADTLYGVTMEEKGISKLLSVKLADVDETLEAVPVA